MVVDTTKIIRGICLPATLGAAVALAGCGAMQGLGKSGEADGSASGSTASTAGGTTASGGTATKPAAKPAARPAPAAAATPAPAPVPSPNAGKIGPGMNERGEVVDSKKVEAGYGQKVKGLEDWEGEITGKPAPGSKFGKLQIGMTATSVVAQLGQPSDQGSYITGKAFIPFYFGSDKYRYEVVYKGQGRLIFASSATYSFGEMHLIWIIHNASEGATR
ncbi:MAG: hypothetical protein RLZZ584_4039 [Pseudomonadota bacterium]